MGPNFSPVIAFNGDKAIAMGPLGEDDSHRADFVTEVRAWIYQPYVTNVSTSNPNTNFLLWSPDDAAAAEIPTSDFRQGPGICWMRQLQNLTNTPFRTGRAFAVAVALISNVDDVQVSTGPNKRGRVTWWGHPIWLTNDASAWTKVTAVFDGLQDPKYAADPQYFEDLVTQLQPLGLRQG